MFDASASGTPRAARPDASRRNARGEAVSHRECACRRGVPQGGRGCLTMRRTAWIKDFDKTHRRIDEITKHEELRRKTGILKSPEVPYLVASCYLISPSMRPMAVGAYDRPLRLAARPAPIGRSPMYKCATSFKLCLPCLTRYITLDAIENPCCKENDRKTDQYLRLRWGYTSRPHPSHNLHLNVGRQRVRIELYCTHLSAIDFHD